MHVGLGRATLGPERDVERQARERVAVRHLGSLPGVVVHGLVAHAQKDELLVVVERRRVIDEREASTGGHGLSETGAIEVPRLRLFGLHRVTRIAPAIRAPVIERVVLVALRGTDVGVLEHRRLFDVHQPRRRLVVVEVAEGDLAHPELERLVPAGDTVHLARSAVRVIGHGSQTGDLPEHRVGVADHEHMLVLLVADRPDQPLLLHQPRAEVVVRLVVHDDVLQRWMIAPEMKLEIGKSEFLENRPENVLRTLVLENPAIGRAGQKPEPRHHGHFITRDRAGVADTPERRHIAVEITALTAGVGTGDDAREAGVAAPRVQHDLDALADDLLEADIVPVRQQVEVDLGQLVDMLVRHQCAHQQDVRAQRRFNRDVAEVLRQQRTRAGRAVDGIGDGAGRLAQQ